MNNKEKEILKSTIGKTVENYKYNTTQDDSDLSIKFTDGSSLTIDTEFNQVDMYFDYIENKNEIEKDDNEIMSKELNIIEAMKMPVGTEFKVIIDGELRENTMKLFSYQDIDKMFKYIDWFSHPKDTYLKSYDWLINAKFIPIQKPVSFMEAVKSDKYIRVDLTGIGGYSGHTIEKLNSYMPLDEMFAYLGREFYTNTIKEIIEKGKWYIED